MISVVFDSEESDFYKNHFFIAYKEMEQSEPSIRVVIIGDSCVGKTALLLRQIEGQFHENSKQTTIVSFLKSVVRTSDTQQVTLELWDTAGTEKYRSLSQVFYRAAQIALICVDSNTLDSNNLQSILEWKAAVLNVEPECQIVLVGTKSDLLQQDATSVYKKLVELKEQAKVNNVFLTSSLTGEGVNDLFTSVALMAKPVLNHNVPDQQNTNSCGC